MGKKKHKKRNKAPAQQTPAVFKKAPFFALPRCPQCGRSVLYRQLAAKPAAFSVRCRCGERFSCRPGLASAVLWLAALLLCFGMTRLVLAVSTDLMPVVFFTALFVAAAFFLYPLTLRAARPKPRKRHSTKEESQLPEKNGK